MRLPFSRAEDSAPIRRRVADLLSGHPDETVGDILVVITELVENVVQHTGDTGELHVRHGDRTVWIEVHDRSRAFPLLQRSDPRRPGGRGLLLVAALTENWGSRPTPTGKLVWARLGTSPAARGLRGAPPATKGS